MQIAERVTTMARHLVALASSALLISALFNGCAGSENNASGGTVGDTQDASTTPAPTATGTTPAPTTTGTTPAPTSTTPDPAGSCNPDFCPQDTSFGEACCVTANGPCGFDMGMGCTSTTTGGNADGG
jgi:hypothetical protein